MTGTEVLDQIAGRCDAAAQDCSLSVRERLELLLRANAYRAEFQRLQLPTIKVNPVANEMVIAGFDAAGIRHELEEYDV